MVLGHFPWLVSPKSSGVKIGSSDIWLQSSVEGVQESAYHIAVPLAEVSRQIPLR